ncbi:MAG TPA: DNA mismatch repair endonuclease MutL [Candidatus Saccharimonadales bacterium]|nr:DNA mismatch repair endonuclease MutL [Candidatus Saccharimonadales bacterium]
MAQTIKILDPAQAIKIAAGEVIERPAHIIKELIENSIDAQANIITIHATSAGKEEISISDNGCGMSPQDALLCFAHHATSKISTVHDLETIVTYGFRGEALSSIASVSHVELITKTEQDKSATRVIVHEGKIIEQTIAAREVGTTLTITNLFATIPARKKFLKSDDTEWNLIVSIFQAFCLVYPNIHFKLFHNDHLSYNCPPTNDMKTRCAQLWSGNLHEQLIDLEVKSESRKTSAENISVVGAISTPHYYRFNRGQIFTFVNNRWVKNIEMTKAILKGYDGVLPTKKYPAAFLFLTIDPTQVDINVHPKKEEVKFLHPGVIQRIIQEAVQKTLSNRITKHLTVNQLSTIYKPYKIVTEPKDFHKLPGSPGYSYAKATAHEQARVSVEALAKSQGRRGEENIPSFIISSEPFAVPTITESDGWAMSAATSTEFSVIPAEAGIQEKIVDNEKVASTVFIKSIAPNPIPTPIPIMPADVNQSVYEQEPYSIVGQFKKTYIILEKNNQLILIDQHAAHERILYEQFKKNMQQTASVRLLFPHIIKLSISEVQQIITYEKLFYKHGIEFEAFSQTELVIQATPVHMQAQAAHNIIHLALTWIKEHSNIDHDELYTQLHEKILTEKACKAACKAGDCLNHEQMNNLIKELLITDNRFCCPHGRPTIWGIELKDIEKHFKRDYVGSKHSSGYLI